MQDQEQPMNVLKDVRSNPGGGVTRGEAEKWRAVRLGVALVLLAGWTAGCRGNKADPVGTSTGLPYHPPGPPRVIAVPTDFPIFPPAEPLPRAVP
jgi:hypothetical protein